jgi:hypothetical protein
MHTSQQLTGILEFELNVKTQIERFYTLLYGVHYEITQQKTRVYVHFHFAHTVLVDQMPIVHPPVRT